MENKFLNIFNISNLLKSIPRTFKIEKYPYTVLKIIPFKTGYKSEDFEKILNTISKYNTSFFESFELDKQNRILKYHPKQSFCFEILFTKDRISYNYAVPSIYKTVFINKLKFLLKDCDVIELKEDYLNDFNNSIKTSFCYKNSWILSLNTDKNINITDSLMIAHSDLQTVNDKVIIQYLFQPLYDFDWKNKWENYYRNYNVTGNLKTSGGIFELLDRLSDFLLEQLDLIINAIMGAVCGEEPIDCFNSSTSNYTKDLTTDTKHKTMYDGFKTGVNLYVKSDNQITIDNISRNVSTIFKDVAGDNELSAYKSKVTDIPNREFKKGMIANTLECRQMIKTPSQSILLKYENLLDKINVSELDIPKDLFEGNGIPLGEIQKGNTYKSINFGNDSNSLAKPLFYLGEMESGKSSFSRRYGIGALERGHSVFAIDTIDGKNVTHIRDYLSSNFPEDKIIVLDFDNEEYAFPCLWNEISDYYLEKMDAAKDNIDRYRIMQKYSAIITEELKKFIDTLQDNTTQRLTEAMKSTLSDIAQLVFMNQGSFGMISECIDNQELRHDLLDKLNIPKNIPFAKNILKLDDDTVSKTTLQGIKNRLNTIMANDELKKFFTIVLSDKKLDFSKWCNNGYAVLIKIPEQYANILATFLVQKLILTVEVTRYDIEEDKRPHTHLLIDEPNQYPKIMEILKERLIWSRKWHLRFLFFIHDMTIFRDSLNNLESAGVSIIMCPTNERNFNQVSRLFKPYTYDAMEEVKKIQAKSNGKLRFALCSIHYKTVNYPCVIKLPLPVEKCFKKIDRSYLNDECAKKYGVSQREYYEEMFRKCDTENEQIKDIQEIKKEEIII